MLEEFIVLQGKFWILQCTAVAMFISLCFIEGVLTKRAITAKPPRELITDAFYWFLSPYCRVVSKIVLAALLVVIALLAGVEDAPALVGGYGPISRQPWPLILLETLVLSDLCSYWAHRTMHRASWLWRFHAIHHSSKTIRWSTIGRVHPINEVINYAAGVLPCLAIGLPLASVLTIIPVMMWWAVAVHSDFKVTFGPLRALLVSPLFHRWHHTHSHEGGNSNFSNVFSLWDRLFGTYYLPSERMPEVFGLDVDDVPETYFGQLLYPFGANKPAADVAHAARSGASVLSSRPASPTRGG